MRVRRAHALARRCGEIAVALGAVVLVGWTLDISALKSLSSSLSSMKANTAIMFVLAGLSVRLTASVRASESRSRAALVSAAAAGAIAAVTLAQYPLEADFGIDQLLFSDDSDFPGRPSPHTTIAFGLVAATLIAMQVARPGPSRSVLWPGVLASVMVVLAAVGYAYDVEYLRGISRQTGVALHTLIGLLVLTAGTLCAQPERSWIAVFVRDSPGAALARRLIPAVIALPLVIGIERVIGSGPLLTSLSVLVAMVAVVALVVYLAGSIDAVDRDRQALAAQLRREAQRDPLTGVFNRRRLDEELELLRSLADRYRLTTAALAIDVDDFKEINDTHGHPAGDAVLVTIADTLRGCVRESDVVGRTGGDEFVVLMPELDPDRAVNSARRVLAELRRASAQSSGPEFTVSIGVAVPGEDGDGTALLAAADRALYRAKAAGGDDFRST